MFQFHGCVHSAQQRMQNLKGHCRVWVLGPGLKLNLMVSCVVSCLVAVVMISSLQI